VLDERFDAVFPDKFYGLGAMSLFFLRIGECRRMKKSQPLQPGAVFFGVSQRYITAHRMADHNAFLYARSVQPLVQIVRYIFERKALPLQRTLPESREVGRQYPEIFGKALFKTQPQFF